MNETTMPKTSLPGINTQFTNSKFDQEAFKPHGDDSAQNPQNENEEYESSREEEGYSLKKKVEPLYFDEILPENSDSTDSDPDETKRNEASNKTGRTRSRSHSRNKTFKLKLASRSNKEKADPSGFFAETWKNRTLSHSMKAGFSSRRKSNKVLAAEDSPNIGLISENEDSGTVTPSSNDVMSSSHTLLGNFDATSASILKAYLNKARAHKEEKISSAVFKRKLVRIISFISFAALGLLAFLLTSYLIFERKISQFSASNDFLINMQNCRLEIYDGSNSDNPGTADVVIKFRAPFIGGDHYSVEGTTITVQSEADPGLCYIRMWVQPNVVINSLEINCLEYCSIVQNSDSFEIENYLTITGDQDVYANFAELTAQGFTFQAEQGNVQINEATLKSSDSSIKLTRGDIIFQASTSFATSFSVSNSSYCLSAPVAVSPILGTDCSASNTITQANFTKLGTLTCTGTANLCFDSTCTVEFTIAAQTTIGTFYANVIQPGLQRTAPNSNLQAMGAPFDFWYSVRFQFDCRYPSVFSAS